VELKKRDIISWRKSTSQRVRYPNVGGHMEISPKRYEGTKIVIE
jgi:hypothetical protein